MSVPAPLQSRLCHLAPIFMTTSLMKFQVRFPMPLGPFGGIISEDQVDSYPGPSSHHRDIAVMPPSLQDRLGSKFSISERCSRDLARSSRVEKKRLRIWPSSDSMNTG